MTDELIRRSAFIQAQAACAIVEAIAKLIESADATSMGRINLAADTRNLIDRYGIGPNAVLTYMSGG